jgi:hypothetical protein
MSTTNGCGHDGKGDVPRSPLEQWQGRWGWTLPPSSNPREGMMKRRMKMERWGR